MQQWIAEMPLGKIHNEGREIGSHHQAGVIGVGLVEDLEGNNSTGWQQEDDQRDSMRDLRWDSPEMVLWAAPVDYWASGG
jgi:hypothetical protein